MRSLNVLDAPVAVWAYIELTTPFTSLSRLSQRAYGSKREKLTAVIQSVEMYENITLMDHNSCSLLSVLLPT